MCCCSAWPLALIVTFLVIFFVTVFSATGISEDSIRSYARKYIEANRKYLIPKDAEPVVQDVKIEKMNLHDEELSIAKVNVRLRGDFETWKTLYVVWAPDYSTYIISDKKTLLN